MQNGSDQRFATTIWSDILKLREPGSPQAAQAVEALCSRYWYPIYACLRRQSFPPEDAKDLTQGFFAHVLSHDFFATADRQKGTFRAYAQAWLKNWVGKHFETMGAKKRGGDIRFISIDQEDVEARYRLEPVDSDDPWTLLERKWAQAVVARAREQLGEEFRAAGKEAYFRKVSPAVFEEGYSGTYSDWAAELGTSESALKNQIPRIRERFRELVREEVAQTVPDRSDVDRELRSLITALSA